MRFWRVEVVRLFDDRGFAAAQCGKALPFRHDTQIDRREAMPRAGGAASAFLMKQQAGKPEAYRTVLRQSRKNIWVLAALVLTFGMAVSVRNAGSISLHSSKG